MEKKQTIYINQAGYLPNCIKYFITTEEVLSFQIKTTNGEYLLSGNVHLYKKKDISTGEKLYIGYFTELDIEGSYIIQLDNCKKSYPFSIKKDIYNDVLYKTLKSFYFQRCGTPLLKEHADEFHRGSCHTDFVPYHSSLGIDGVKDVTGGWHDAGDYGRYITPGAIAVVTMMIGYEQYPEKFNFNCIGLPEDGNGKSDFINEIKYELDWMFKMQELDESSPMYGALHYMINSKDYAWVTPDKDDYPQYILNYSSLSTVDFAAVMACASRIFKDIDKDFSDKALTRALLAWNFIQNYDHSSIDEFVRPDEIWTGGYAKRKEYNKFRDSDNLWPAVELFLTTGKQEFHNIVKKHFKNKMKLTGGLTWMDKSGFPEIQYALSKNSLIDEKLQKDIRKGLIKRCDGYINTYNSDGFLTVLNSGEYQWGSNGELLIRSLQLIMGYILNKKDIYKEAALSQLNYILGLNIHSKSFIAGIGTDYTTNIHHASFQNDNIDYCFPGMLTGGANSFIEENSALHDKILYKNCPPGTPPAKCYIDHCDSFSSNENCILYSAPLIPVAAFFSFFDL